MNTKIIKEALYNFSLTENDNQNIENNKKRIEYYKGLTVGIMTSLIAFGDLYFAALIKFVRCLPYDCIHPKYFTNNTIWMDTMIEEMEKQGYQKDEHGYSRYRMGWEK